MTMAQYRMALVTGPGGRSRSGTDAPHKTRFSEARDFGHRQVQDAKFDSNGRRGRKSVRSGDKQSRRGNDQNAGLVLPVRIKTKSHLVEQPIFERDTRSMANDWNNSESLQNQFPPVYDVPGSSRQQGRQTQRQALRSGPPSAGPRSIGPIATGLSGDPLCDLQGRQTYTYGPYDNCGDNYDDRYNAEEGSGRQGHQLWQGSQRSPSPEIMLIARELLSSEGIYNKDGDYYSDVEEKPNQRYSGAKTGYSSREEAYDGPAGSYERW